MNRSATIVPAALLALVLTASACSDGDGSATSTVPTTNSSVATSPDTSTTTASTVPPPSATATTQAPTTTVDQIAATKQAIAAAAVQSRQDYLYAVRNYDAPDALDVLSRTTAEDSPSWDLAVKNMDTLRAKGWRTRENPNVPSTLTVEGDVQLDGPSATRAELTGCVIDSGVVYEPGGAPNGSDTIVNDEIVANRNRITMVLDNGAWKLFDGTGIGSWNGATTCPAG